MHTLSFQAPEELYQHLGECAEHLDRSKGYLIRAALAEYLQDIEDVIEARQIQASYDKNELISFEEVKRQNQLD